MRKLFQWHRGGLKESVETQVEVKDFADIEAIVAKHCQEIGMPNVYYDLSTKYAYDDSDRLGDEWKDSYYVMPCFNSKLDSSSFKNDRKYSDNIFAYVGSMASW